MPNIPDFSDLMDRWHEAVDEKRSASLDALNDALVAYQADRTPPKLEQLAAALDTWIRKKTNIFGKFSSHRDPELVAALRKRVANAFLLVPPRTWDPRYPGILIAHDLYRGTDWVPNEFVGAVRAALNTIESGPIGKALLLDISRSCQSRGHKVIIEHKMKGSTAVPLDDISPASRKKVQILAAGGVLGSPSQLEMTRLNSQAGLIMQPTVRNGYVRGGGTNAVVCWAHNDPLDHDPRPGYISLAHELVHVYHFVMGACFAAYTGGLFDPNSGMAQEEMRTVGIGPYADEIPSENAIRAEHPDGGGHRDNYNQLTAGFWAGAQPKIPDRPRTPAQLKAIPRPPVGPRPAQAAPHA
jgi:hypothetical protein